MLRTTLLTLTLTVSSGSYGACLTDSPEIVDIGPDSSLICNMLESRLPQSDIAILDRQIHSPNTISVIVSVDEQPESLTYTLTGADWKLINPALAVSY